MDKKKIADYLMANTPKQKRFEQDYFDLGICEVVLGNFPEAMGYFDQAVSRMFEDRPLWKDRQDQVVYDGLLEVGCVFMQ